MMNEVWVSFAWVFAASILGFGISAVFAGRLGLSRRVFLIPYVILSSAFLSGYLLWSGIDVSALFAHNWAWGLIAGVLAGTFMVRNVRSQPASRNSAGGELVFDLAWVGLTYGIIDGLFLNVMPALVVWTAFAQLGWTASWTGTILVGLLALAASLLVTLAYHLGYPEFRNKRVGLVLVGNWIITLAYLLSTNPLGAVISHAVMHVAAVLQGPDTTIQLPPHARHRLKV